MNSSSSSAQDSKLAILCDTLEFQKRLLIERIATIEKRKNELGRLLELLNHYRLKEKRK